MFIYSSSEGSKTGNQRVQTPTSLLYEGWVGHGEWEISIPVPTFSGKSRIPPINILRPGADSGLKRYWQIRCEFLLRFRRGLEESLPQE